MGHTSWRKMRDKKYFTEWQINQYVLFSVRFCGKEQVVKFVRQMLEAPFDNELDRGNGVGEFD